MSPALELLYSRKNRDKTFEEGAKNITNAATQECINLIKTKTSLTIDIKSEVIERIKSLKILTGLTDDFLSIDIDLENLYSELALNGTESYIDLWHETLRHIKKLENEPRDRWKFQINQFGKTFITDIVNETLCELSLMIFFI